MLEYGYINIKLLCYSGLSPHCQASGGCQAALRCGCTAQCAGSPANQDSQHSSSSDSELCALESTNRFCGYPRVLAATDRIRITHSHGSARVL